MGENMDDIGVGKKKHKRKKIWVDFFKMNFWSSEDTVKKMKKQARSREKIISIQIFDKEYLSGINK